ncbi:MAG: hypothetical protein MdMp014T_2699 [Treponematales bacterium]
MDFPEKLLRGISDKNWIDDNGRISAAAFQFDPGIDRTDDFEEASINWYDDDEALNILLMQHKESDETLQFKGGVGVLPKNWVDTMMKNPSGIGIINYERHELPNNKYHGNLLRLSSLPKNQRTMISATLAMGVERIIPSGNTAN